MSTELRSRIALLYRRAGFGGRPDELDAGVAAGYKATVDRLLQFGPDPTAAPPPTMAPYPPPADMLPADPVDRAVALTKARQTANQDAHALSLWWLDRMATTANPLQEKLTLFWHGHFATSVQKVVDPGYMYGQNQIFRTAGAGNFTDLTLAVSKDPAMLIWLDANLDRKASPNENFARELLELFTVGIGHYSEDDIKNAARAFTGWQLNAQTRAFSFAANQHDTGMRTFFGQSGSFTGEDVVRMAAASPDAARFVAQKVFSHFARPVTFADPIVTQLAAGFRQGPRHRRAPPRRLQPPRVRLDDHPRRPGQAAHRVRRRCVAGPGVARNRQQRPAGPARVAGPGPAGTPQRRRLAPERLLGSTPRPRSSASASPPPWCRGPTSRRWPAPRRPGGPRLRPSCWAWSTAGARPRPRR